MSASLSELLDRLSASEAVPHSDLEDETPPEDLWVRLERPEPSPESVRVVSKRRYCQRCEHLSNPPTVACTREGTEIEALVGSDRFRVRNCPVERE
ncbi:MAG: hypothetical protein IH933_09310 [Euryarchaeota archaeon]|nr:hypothetical protein [Euryarchaeota archaeon]